MKTYIFALICIWFCISCDSPSKQTQDLVLPRYSGQQGEIICVVQHVDNSENKQHLQNIFSNVFGTISPFIFPQEKIFSLKHIPNTQFKKIHKAHRNIILIDIQDRYAKTTASIHKEIWAKDQMVLQIKSPSYDSIIGYLTLQRMENWVEHFRKTEENRIQQYIRHTQHTKIQQYLAPFGIDMPIPKDFKVKKQTDNFLWLEKYTTRRKANTHHDIIQGMCIWKYPYHDTAQFSLDSLLQRRNAVLKTYIPGPNTGSYMMTEQHPQFYPLAEKTAFQGFGVFVRGMWKMHNAYMGGAFIQVNILDKDKTHILCVEGFIHAPYFGKREYLRVFEANLKQLKIL